MTQKASDPGSTPTASSLTSRIKGVWRREQVLHGMEGALVFMRWGLLLFFAAVLIDWLAGRWGTNVPAVGRAVILLLVLSGALYKAWKAGWRSIRPFNAMHTALQIEERHGGMKSLLVTAIQFQRQKTAASIPTTVAKSLTPGTSEALCELTCQRAEASAGGLVPKDEVRFATLRRPAVIALFVVLFLGVLAAGTHGPLLVAGLGRIFAPWLAISYPTRTRLELVGGDLVAQEGQPVRIVARVSGVVPKRAEIAISTGKGRPRVRQLAVVDGQCEYLIETAFRSFDYRLTAGDARSPWHAVQVITAPAITQAEVRLDFPAYIQRATETVDALTLTVPETTRIHWTLSLDRAVREATMNPADMDPVPLLVSEDGRTVTGQQAAVGSRSYSFAWVDREHGFAFTSPNYYLQVAPDRPPSVEMTHPKNNLYATLGRKLDLAFRGRDDHGVAESVIAYRVDKTEEQKIHFAPAKPIDGTEQVIDWDYRSALPDLEVGQTVTFALELTDSYPGDTGPHRARSETRHIQFMTREDYLEQIERHKKRLLSQLRTIYRDERKAYEVVLQLDPFDPVFVQTCQLEAVRQELMRERLDTLAARMLDLSNDLAANNVTDEPVIETLATLRSTIQTVSVEHVSPAAEALRALAGEEDSKRLAGAAQFHAAYKVNSCARELGLLVMHLGFEDAAEVMAYELHAAAQTQAALRLRTMTPTNESTPRGDGGATSGLPGSADAQERLANWLSRLFAASPKGRESTIQEALVEFTLTRLVKQLVDGGTIAQMRQAAKLIREKDAGGAARLQAEVIAALLKAEFRLRVGAEREALAKAMDLFASQEQAQKKLRLELKSLDAQAFQAKRPELSRTQTALHRNMQLLLMPEIPPPRARLFDDALPPPPPVNDLLVAADEALATAESHLRQNPETVEQVQLEAESALSSLANHARKRMLAMTQAVRIDRLSYAGSDTGRQLEQLGERQISLLEKTEDAAADGLASAYLAAQQEALADAADTLWLEVADRLGTAASASEHSPALVARIEEVLQAMQRAVPSLNQNEPGKAIGHQKAALSALGGARALLVEHGQNIGAFAAILASTKKAVAPGRVVAEIEEEQRDMLALTRNTQPENLPDLAIAQKNLVHAVDAILVVLDPVAHLVESGTVMLFAKEDMKSAGTALEIKDPVEALDAQAFIVETLQELGARIAAIVPQYRYTLELTEALHETVPEGILIREAQRGLREKATEDADAAALAAEQRALKARAEVYGALVNTIAGLGVVEASAGHMAQAERLLKAGDRSAAVAEMVQAEQTLAADVTDLLTLMGHLAKLLNPPAEGQLIPPEFPLLREVLILAARQKNIYRRSYAAGADETAGFAPNIREIADACKPFIERAGERRELLVTAREQLVNAASAAGAADRAKALDMQKQAVGNLRHFIAWYALKFHVVVPPPTESDPAPSEDFTENEDMFALFMPGVVSGNRPPDGRLEWEVLGKRDRAALNENFARELPLEYRAILKDYYERLAR